MQLSTVYYQLPESEEEESDENLESDEESDENLESEEESDENIVQGPNNRAARSRRNVSYLVCRYDPI